MGPGIGTLSVNLYTNRGIFIVGCSMSKAENKHDAILRSRYLKLTRNGKFVRIIEVPDERIAMIKSFKRIGDKYRVQPIASATARALLRERRV